MISVDEARAAIAAHVRALPSVQLPVGDAVGRVLAEDVAAAVDLPPFPQSGMDGWAARHQDIASGRLELAERDIVDVRAGAEPHRLSPGLACRISTGAPIPAGADTVIRREDADWRDGALFIAPVPERGANVRAQGETVTRGQTIGRAGHRLDAGVQDHRCVERINHLRGGPDDDAGRRRHRLHRGVGRTASDRAS